MRRRQQRQQASSAHSKIILVFAISSCCFEFTQNCFMFIIWCCFLGVYFLQKWQSATNFSWSMQFHMYIYGWYFAGVFRILLLKNKTNVSTAAGKLKICRKAAKTSAEGGLCAAAAADLSEWIYFQFLDNMWGKRLKNFLFMPNWGWPIIHDWKYIKQMKSIFSRKQSEIKTQYNDDDDGHQNYNLHLHNKQQNMAGLGFCCPKNI